MKNVFVTGGSGFLGGWVTGLLREKKVRFFAPSRAECNLLDLGSTIRTLSFYKPETVVHLAATVGGIGANQKEPGRFFFENAQMGMNLIEASRIVGIKKFVQVGTVCSYPLNPPLPFSEKNLWDGYPEPTNAPYGVAKKMMLTMLDGYRKQYGLNGIYLIPANLYGPHDHLDVQLSHVIPALIRKFYDAFLSQKPTVKVWGTGKATREFLYVKDAAEAIVLAAERYNKPDPVNLGSGQEITIRQLAEDIARMVGYYGKTIFDATKPDGQPRRLIDSSRAFAEFGWKAKTSFAQGLKDTFRYIKDTWVNI